MRAEANSVHRRDLSGIFRKGRMSASSITLRPGMSEDPPALVIKLTKYAALKVLRQTPPAVSKAWHLRRWLNQLIACTHTGDSLQALSKCRAVGLCGEGSDAGTFYLRFLIQGTYSKQGAKVLLWHHLRHGMRFPLLECAFGVFLHPIPYSTFGN